jgi:hypothetical protein
MRRVVSVFLSMFIVLAAAAMTQADQPNMAEEQEGSLLSALVGSYQVVGRFPESRKTYSGDMEISRKGDRLILEKKINGVKTTAEASIQSATADLIPVLRAAWKQGKIDYEATYLVHTDLDNYPRLTGYIYRSGRETKTPGLEALFFKEALSR